MADGKLKQRVMILESGKLLGERIAGLISRIHPGTEVVSAPTISTLVDSVARNKPDILLLDIGTLHDREGIIGQVKAKRPGIKIVLTAGDAGEIYRKTALRMGADDIVDKTGLEMFIRQRLFEKQARCGADNGDDSEKS